MVLVSAIDRSIDRKKVSKKRSGALRKIGADWTE
jgi:hypothetical protein